MSISSITLVPQEEPADLASSLDTNGTAGLTLNTLLGLADHGIHVFPVWGIRNDGTCQCGGRDSCDGGDNTGKHPIPRNGRSAATTDAETITTWSSNFPGCNWGAPTGDPNHFFVLDNDDPESKQDHPITSLQTEPTLRVSTGKGWHDYYLNPKGGIKSSAKQLAPNLDTRGDGGYVILPGSRHRSGKLYQADRPFTMAAMVEPSAALLASFQALRAHKTQKNLPQMVVEGGRDNFLTSVAGRLRRAGLTKKELAPSVHSVNQLRCDPPMSGHDVERIIESIGDREGGELDYPKVFTLQTVADLFSEPDIEYAIDGLLAKGTHSLLVGKPGVGKTFLTLAMVTAVATGHDLYGRKVLPGAAVFVAAEGAVALKPRLLALIEHHGLTPGQLTNIRILKDSPQLASEADVTSLLAAMDELRVPINLIIIDTLAETSLGLNENSTEMQGYLHGAKRLAETTGAAVVSIHHMNKVGGVRGSTSISGSVDSIIQLDKPLGGTLKVSSHKSRLDEGFPSFTLQSVPVNLPGGGTNIVYQLEGSTRTKTAPVGTVVSLTHAQDQLFGLLRRLHGIAGEPVPIATIGEESRLGKSALYKHLKALDEQGVLLRWDIGCEPVSLTEIENRTYRLAELHQTRFTSEGQSIHLFPWDDDDYYPWEADDDDLIPG